MMGIALVTHQLTIAWTEHGIDSLLNLPSITLSLPKQNKVAVTNSHTHDPAKRNTTIKRIRYTIIEINSHEEHLHVKTIK